MANIGYARVSKRSQSMEAQIAELKEFGCKQVFVEARKGLRGNRPELDAAMSALHAGDRLLVTDADRLTRDGDKSREIADTAKRLGAKVHDLSNSEMFTKRRGALDELMAVFFGYTSLSQGARAQRGRDFYKGIRQRTAKSHHDKVYDSKGVDVLKRLTVLERSHICDTVRETRPELPWSKVLEIVITRVKCPLTVRELMLAAQQLVLDNALGKNVLKFPRVGSLQQSGGSNMLWNASNMSNLAVINRPAKLRTTDVLNLVHGNPPYIGSQQVLSTRNREECSVV